MSAGNKILKLALKKTKQKAMQYMEKDCKASVFLFCSDKYAFNS